MTRQARHMKLLLLQSISSSFVCSALHCLYTKTSFATRPHEPLLLWVQGHIEVKTRRVTGNTGSQSPGESWIILMTLRSQQQRFAYAVVL
jgi:hypothetical protein